MSVTNKKKKRRRVSECRNKNTEAQCKGKYVLDHEEDAPVFTCEVCGDQELRWKKFYNEYLALWRDKENWNIKKHKVSCVLGFFCYMYNQVYEVPYIFIPQNPNPYSSKECRDVQKLLVAFNGDAHEVRRYIYWLFKKQIKKSTKITSFGYLNTPALVRKFKIYSQNKKSFNRSSKLPKSLVEWCKENTPYIIENYELETMNDLGALLSYTNNYKDKFDLSQEVNLIKYAEQAGLVKNGKLNLRG